MSSRDGIPVDVTVVDSDDGDRRVPGGRLGCLEVFFLLNEDMVNLCRGWRLVLILPDRWSVAVQSFSFKYN
jgi:hypothetical protein